MGKQSNLSDWHTGMKPALSLSPERNLCRRCLVMGAYCIIIIHVFVALEFFRFDLSEELLNSFFSVCWVVFDLVFKEIPAFLSPIFISLARIKPKIFVPALFFLDELKALVGHLGEIIIMRV